MTIPLLHCVCVHACACRSAFIYPFLMYMLYYNNIDHAFFACTIYDPDLIRSNIGKDVLNVLVVSRWFVNFVLRLYDMSEIGPSLNLLSVLIVLIVHCLS